MPRSLEGGTQPLKTERCEGYSFVPAGFVEQADVSIGQPRETRVCC